MGSLWQLLFAYLQSPQGQQVVTDLLHEAVTAGVGALKAHNASQGQPAAVPAPIAQAASELAGLEASVHPGTAH